MSTGENRLGERINNIENIIISTLFAFVFIIMMLRPIKSLTSILGGYYYTLATVLFLFFWLIAGFYMSRVSWYVSERFGGTLAPVAQKIVRYTTTPITHSVSVLYLVLIIIGIPVGSSLSGLSLTETIGLLIISAIGAKAPNLFKKSSKKKKKKNSH